MRALIFIVILAIIIMIIAVATGFLDINRIRGGKAPDISVTRNGVTAQEGRRRPSTWRPDR